jgi:hypothetical protein
MQKMKKFSIITIIALVLSFVATTKTYAIDKKVKGSGKVVSIKMNVSPFQRIEIDGIFNLYLEQGEKESVIVETDDNLQEYIIAKVDGNTLKIRNKKGISIIKQTKLNIYVTIRNVYDLHVDGVCNIVAKNQLKLERLNVTVRSVGNVKLNIISNKLIINSSGVSDCELTGKARDLEVKLSGVGNIFAQKMIANKVDVKSSGVGNTKVHAIDEISIYTSGVGNVTFYGKANVKSMNASGVGKIKKVN